jgi:hypothetical protein
VHSPVSVARRWLPRRRLSTILATSVLASVFAFGAGAASPLPAAAATAPWYDVEVYYMRLVNCTRTGGWVLADGRCSGYGSGRYSRYVPPLRLGPNLSSVSRAWAKHLAVNNGCYHGDPGARMRAAGFRGWSWGENIGCGGGGGVYAAVLASHRMMQAEKSTNGGHWKNIKNPRFFLAGVGIWVYNGRPRVVTDFYGG